MQTAYEWSEQISQNSSLHLPECLSDIKERGKFLDDLDKIIGKHISESFIRGNLNGQLSNFSDSQKSALFVEIVNFARKWFTYNIGDYIVISICLKYWSGCLSAAKLIALSTRSGPNTSQTRASGFSTVDIIANHDFSYKSGVEAAPEFKRLRNEGFSLDGVPSNSVIRHYFS